MLDQDELTVIDRLYEFLGTGGVVLFVIAGLSVLALAIVLLKLAQFSWLRLWSVRFIAEAAAAWHGGDIRRSLAILASARHPVARAMEFAARECLNAGPGRQLREERIAGRAAAVLADLQAYLPTLALIATLSPLLGLLGTVIGMIDAFQALEAAGSRVDPAILSGGIWQALLTTAAGLSLAIPATVAHHWLAGVVDRVARLMEEAVNTVMEPPGVVTSANPATGGTAIPVPAVATV